MYLHLMRVKQMNTGKWHAVIIEAVRAEEYSSIAKNATFLIGKQKKIN